MRIRLDEQDNLSLPSNPETLGAVMLDITTLADSQGRAIQQISLDGEVVPVASLTPEWGTRAVAEVDSLEIETAPLSNLVMEALEQVAEVIPELPSACHELAREIVGESPALYFGQFNQLLDIWKVLKERQLQVASSLGVVAELIEFSGTNALVHNETLEGLLKGARALMEASQFPELSELLSHELCDMAEGESELIDALKVIAES